MGESAFLFYGAKFMGALILLFRFQGGLRKCINKFRGALFIAFVFSGGLFSDQRKRWEAAEKNQEGLHDILENSGGPFIAT